MIKAALNRLEGQLGALVETQQKFVLKADLQELKTRVETLQRQIKALEERIGA
jgi:polyhydroxyalkanoate synthesis regulator phasin